MNFNDFSAADAWGYPGVDYVQGEAIVSGTASAAALQAAFRASISGTVNVTALNRSGTAYRVTGLGVAFPDQIKAVALSVPGVTAVQPNAIYRIQPVGTSSPLVAAPQAVQQALARTCPPGQVWFDCPDISGPFDPNVAWAPSLPCTPGCKNPGVVGPAFVGTQLTSANVTPSASTPTLSPASATWLTVVAIAVGAYLLGGAFAGRRG
jgi:hypothetical protein